MHFFLFLEFIIFHLILIVTSRNISTHSHHASDTSTIHHTSTIHVPNIHPIPITSRTVLPGPTRTNHPVVPFHTGDTPPSRHSGQEPIFVVFEVVGGLLAIGFLLCLGRCCYQYRKAPKRDRIAEVLNRHHLQRELEELERNPQILRRLSLREPAPPYCPAPPSYEVTSSPIIVGTNYTDIDTHNVPTSPSPQQSILITDMHTHNLPTSSSPQPSILIPDMHTHNPPSSSSPQSSVLIPDMHTHNPLSSSSPQPSILIPPRQAG